MCFGGEVRSRDPRPQNFLAFDTLSGLADSDVFPLLHAHVTPHTINPITQIPKHPPPHQHQHQHQHHSLSLSYICFHKVPLLRNLQLSHPCFIRYFSFLSLTISSTPFPTLTISTPTKKKKKNQSNTRACHYFFVLFHDWCI